MTTDIRFALQGRVVTMDEQDTVLPDGVIYVRGNKIAAVSNATTAKPAGFENVPIITSSGTIYPGLIDLHNHLSYDALKLWQVPKRYTNRDDWARHPDYRRLISGPMNVLGRTASYPEAISRYVECKCLLGGVTTAQGIALFSNTGIIRFYRGFLRNAEVSDGPDLPAAEARIADVVAEDATAFLKHLRSSSCLLLHLSEGTDQRARNHFNALKLDNGEIAITRALAGIHCVALQSADFALLARHGGSMIWSPLSNMLLYGTTADVHAAKAAGVTIGIGSDWSPSGSKNLLGELKVARAYSDTANDVFSNLEIVAMATRNAAKILRWDKAVGSLEASKRADLIVVRGKKAKDPYLQLIASRETDIELVMIDGVRRCGIPSLMADNPDMLESWTIAGETRRLNLSGTDVDPLVARLTLRDAADRLAHGLKSLKNLAEALEKQEPVRHGAAAGGETQWFLALDHEEPAGMSIRPRFDEERNAPARIESLLAAAAAKPLSQLLGPLELDAMTAVDDAGFLTGLDKQINLPKAIKDRVKRLHVK
ncbi:amidohydrolase family protein [Paraburkholderia sp. RL17-347-BIC-D]|uniref:amidohydrolase family protein n=1 Tax=Paraburkholderia sp. RL17-347-BIC-D TaxID=3031632 RepID=UPI0038B7AB2D